MNPSLAVERIREIIVGRHLERLENRVIRLESGNLRETSGQISLDDRLHATEARLEALKENVQRIVETSREELEARILQQRSETQRLAAQIQYIASHKLQESETHSSTHPLENKIGTWIATWQKSFQEQLRDREERLAAQLRSELASLGEATNARLTHLETRSMDRDSMEDRFHRIAQAARTLADCASPATLGSRPAPC
jgi:hypothetical protein